MLEIEAIFAANFELEQERLEVTENILEKCRECLMIIQLSSRNLYSLKIILPAMSLVVALVYY